MAQAKSDKKPNILIIWGDDIGWFNISAYNHGIMGYRTPNIDRLAKEGTMFTDWYGQQSCTAGRAAFITGQSPIRTGMTKVGLPGSKLGLQPEDPTIAELLKPQGYVCGQFGKNHLGDRNEFLPTVHGFDEFFGNLYHLNAEEEPELPDWPSTEEFPRFNDVSQYDGHTIKFYKLPQLGLWITYCALRKSGKFEIEDLNKMTAFADYIVPVGLRLMGITSYSDKLEKAINSYTLIPRDSDWEIEIRAHCIYATALLCEEINKKRTPENKIIIPQIDARFWLPYHTTSWPHHLTKTIMY